MTDQLNENEKRILLDLARQAITLAVRENKPLKPNLKNLPHVLQQPGASFVTLTRQGQLRGCIGALEPYQPLALDVCEHAMAAALQDFRFPPLQVDELENIKIEISHLTLPTALDYESPVDLLDKIRSNIDGVILKDGPQRATFLPQVWKKVPNKAEFLGHLCQKMGASPDLWRRKKIQVFTYQVEEFHE